MSGTSMVPFPGPQRRAGLAQSWQFGREERKLGSELAHRTNDFIASEYQAQLAHQASINEMHRVKERSITAIGAIGSVYRRAAEETGGDVNMAAYLEPLVAQATVRARRLIGE